MAGVLFQTGAFGDEQARAVWAVLAGSSVGLLAGTLGRLYSSAFYALGDTRTPLRCAIARVAVAVLLGWWMSLHLPRLLGLDPRWGTAGLTAAASVASWVELTLLRRALNLKVGPSGLPLPYALRLWACAVLAAGPGFAIAHTVRGLHPAVTGLMALAPFGALYLGLTWVAGVPECRVVLDRVTRVTRRLGGR